MFKTGALLPPGLNWQMGKTAASIAFVNESDAYMLSCSDPNSIIALSDAIAKVKSGELVLTEWTSPAEYLKSLPQA